MTILTIGHSTHTPADFTAYAKSAGIANLLDIRSHPTSRWEWWRVPQVTDWTREAGLGWGWNPFLGGWTAKDADLAPEMAKRGVDLAAYSNGVFPKQRIGVDRGDFDITNPDWASRWVNQGLYDYNWFTSTPRFRAGIRELILTCGGEDAPATAVYCAEAPWWKCHRSMVADVLFYLRVPVYHVMPIQRTRQDELTGQYRVRISPHDATERINRYSPEVRKSWDLI